MVFILDLSKVGILKEKKDDKISHIGAERLSKMKKREIFTMPTINDTEWMHPIFFNTIEIAAGKNPLGCKRCGGIGGLSQEMHPIGNSTVDISMMVLRVGCMLMRKIKGKCILHGTGPLAITGAKWRLGCMEDDRVYGSKL